MRKIALLVALMLAGSAAATAARADVIYHFSFIDNNTSQIANLVITVPTVGAPATAISGTFGSLTVTGLSDWDGATNTIDPSLLPYVTFGGFAFTTSDNNIYNLFSFRNINFFENIRACPTGNCYLGANSPYDTVTVQTLTDIPEPAGIAALGTGMFAALMFRRRRA